MNNLLRRLSVLALGFAALACISLSAQTSIKTAVLEPGGTREVSNQTNVNSTVRNAIIEAINTDSLFQVTARGAVDRGLAERQILKNWGFFSKDEARELGKMLGVDYIFTSEMSRQVDSLEINCVVQETTTGDTIATESVLVRSPVSARMINVRCGDMVVELLKAVRLSASNIVGSSGSAGSVASGGVSARTMLSGLNAEIAASVKNVNSIPKWNRIKANYTVEVDLSGVNIARNRVLGSDSYIVSGSLTIGLKHQKGDKTSSVIELNEFTEKDSQGIKRRINGQINPVEVVKSMVDGLPEDGNIVNPTGRIIM
jgi:hypothetical protein